MSTNEFGNIAFDLPKHQSNVIKVIGVGGGGSNAINHMFLQGIKGVDFVICNTDAQALQSSGVPNKIQLGVSLTEGLGAGANPEVGEQAAIENIDDIKAMLQTNTKMVFITAGMGGGTGTGAAPVIAKLAMELDILTVGIVTIPFQFEGKMRNDQALIGVEKLRNNVDSLIIINNNKLREVYGNLGFKAGFSKADEVLATASRGIAEVITHHYTQNIDLRDAKTVLSKSGTAIMGSALASGQNRAGEAIMKALDSPLLNDNKITGAKNVLLLIVSGAKEITIDEIGAINDHIQSEAGHGANIIMGVGEDENLNESIAVTIIATGFDVDQQNEISNTEAKKVIHTLNDTSDSINTKPEKNISEYQQQPLDINPPIIKHKLEELEIPSETVPSQSHILSKEQLTESTPNDLVSEDTEDYIIQSVNPEPKIDSVSDEDSMALTFDLPLPKKDNMPPNDLEPQQTLFQLADDIKDTESNSTSENEPPKANISKETRYLLEDELDNTSKTISELTIEDQDLVFDKKTISQETTDSTSFTSNIDPIHAPISEMLKARSEERKRKMKDFNYKFNNTKIDDIEKEPAYKRQGIDLEDNPSISNSSPSRTSLSIDDNDDIQLRNNNSFLHDNVD